MKVVFPSPPSLPISERKKTPPLSVSPDLSKLSQAGQQFHLPYASICPLKKRQKAQRDNHSSKPPRNTTPFPYPPLTSLIKKMDLFTDSGLLLPAFSASPHDVCQAIHPAACLDPGCFPLFPAPIEPTAGC